MRAMVGAVAGATGGMTVANMSDIYLDEPPPAKTAWRTSKPADTGASKPIKEVRFFAVTQPL